MHRAKARDKTQPAHLLAGLSAPRGPFKDRVISAYRNPTVKRLSALRRQSLRNVLRMMRGLAGQVLTEAVYPPLVIATVAAGALAFGGWFAGALFAQLDSAVRILLWAVPLTLLAVTVTVDVAYATLSVARGRRDVRVYGIRYAGWEATSLRPSGDGESGPTLIRLAFASSRGLPLDGKSSSQVVPEVSFYAMPQRELVFEDRGRWATEGDGERSGDDADLRSPGSTLTSRTSLPFDIVAKYTGDEHCYALVGDDPGRTDLERPNEARKLKAGLYGVRVRLLGRRTSKAFWFLLGNMGQGNGLRIVDYDARHSETPAGFEPG